MTRNPVPTVNARYGAPMGRGPNLIQGCTGKVTLHRIRLNSRGYDVGGAYWGLGSPLFWACDESGALDTFFRAADRKAAKTYILDLFPAAKFNR